MGGHWLVHLGVDQLTLIRIFYVFCIIVFSQLYAQQQNT